MGIMKCEILIVLNDIDEKTLAELNNSFDTRVRSLLTHSYNCSVIEIEINESESDMLNQTETDSHKLIREFISSLPPSVAYLQALIRTDDSSILISRHVLEERSAWYVKKAQGFIEDGVDHEFLRALANHNPNVPIDNSILDLMQTEFEEFFGEKT